MNKLFDKVPEIIEKAFAFAIPGLKELAEENNKTLITYICDVLEDHVKNNRKN